MRLFGLHIEPGGVAEELFVVSEIFKGILVVAKRAPAFITKPEAYFAGFIEGAAEFFDIGKVDNPAVKALAVGIVGGAKCVFIGQLV